MTHKIEHNIATGEIIERELTPAELTELEKDKIAKTLRLQNEAEKAETKAALLNRLGISADEARLLLS